MWMLSQPWWEFVLRAVIVYGFVFLLLRILGKRQVGQLTSFDFVLLLIISNSVQNSMNAGDNTITAGLILSTVLVLTNLVVSYFMFRSKKFEQFVIGSPTVLVHDGKACRSQMLAEKITHRELETALRKEGIADINLVRFAILEPNGQITVIRK